MFCRQCHDMALLLCSLRFTAQGSLPQTSQLSCTCHPSCKTTFAINWPRIEVLLGAGHQTSGSAAAWCRPAAARLWPPAPIFRPGVSSVRPTAAILGLAATPAAIAIGNAASATSYTTATRQLHPATGWHTATAGYAALTTAHEQPKCHLATAAIWHAPAASGDHKHAS